MNRIKRILFEDETVTDRITNAGDFHYMRIIQFNLKLLHAWPRKEIGEKNASYWINYANFVLCMLCMISYILYIKLHSDALNFFELGQIYITVLMDVVWWTRVTLSMTSNYRKVGTIFLNKMHLLFYKDVSDYAMQTYRKIHFISHKFTLFLTIQMYGGIFLFNIIPFWNNYSSGKFKEKTLYNTTYEHTLYSSLPFNSSTNINGYVVSCLLFWFVSYICSACFCMLDLLLSLMVFNLWGHLKILLHDLGSFPLPGKLADLPMDERNANVNGVMYSDEELKLISHKLKQCIDYHRMIADFSNKMTETFGSMLSIYYMFHQGSGCLLLLECSAMTAEALIRYLPLSFILFQQLIQLSVIFELIGSTSEKLKDAVYGVPWQYMDTNNRKTVAIFLCNVQDPIHVKALGVVSVGVTTMATIIKTSLSYFAFLRSIN